VVPTAEVSDAEVYDVVVVGGGPGGYAVALYGAAAGLRIAVVEKDKVGGTCLHRGCVPAKELLETASVMRTVAGAKEFGVQASQPSVDFSASQARKAKVVDQLWRGLSGLLRSRGVTILTGTGRLEVPGPDGVHRVRVDPAAPGASAAAASGGRGADRSGSGGEAVELLGRHVVLASGSVPRTIPGFEVDGTLVLTSDEVLSLETLPRSVAIIGGGVVGCEFASMFADLGVQVVLLEALPRLLPVCDPDVVEVLVRSLRRRGVTVHTGVRVLGHAPNGTGTTVSFAEGDEGEATSVTVDAVVVSVGRRPRTEGLLAEGTGVELADGGYVRTDERMRTTAPNVYAIGDLVATPQLAHVGFAEAIVAVKDILGEPVVPVDYDRVPWCIYTHPEVAATGLSEQAARDAGFDVVVKKDPIAGNSRARILGETDGLVKVVAEREPSGRVGRILGVHMVGPWVTEQLGQAYLSVNWEATVEEVGHLVQPHPTLSEAFGETALALTGRGLHVG
jgi:dihydrolipoamide dehydrogenase